MDNLDYKANSRRSKEDIRANSSERRKVEKVVNGNVRTRKKGEINRFKDVFITEDISNVKSYIVMDVLIPAAKKAISDIVVNGIDMILYGESKGKRNDRGSTYVSYRDYSRRDDRRPSARVRADFEYDDIVFDNRAEAEKVLDCLGDILQEYGVVTVADLYDLAGESCDFTFNKFGWTSIRNATVERTRGGGYFIKLPRAMAIN